MTIQISRKTPTTVIAEKWEVLKIKTQDDEYFKVFASVVNDEWRISSGAYHFQELKEDDEYWYWPQLSGSVYCLKKDALGIENSYHKHILDKLIAGAKSLRADIFEISLPIETIPKHNISHNALKLLSIECNKRFKNNQKKRFINWLSSYDCALNIKPIEICKDEASIIKTFTLFDNTQ